jgi:hypothetical protein
MSGRQNFKGYGRDAKEMRLMPKNRPTGMQESFFVKIQDLTTTMFNMLGDMLTRSQVGQEINIQSVSDFYKVANGMAALTKSAVEIERWEMEKTRRIEDVAAIMKKNMMDLLVQRPDLYQEMLPLIDQAADMLTEEYVAKEDAMPPIDIN